MPLPNDKDKFWAGWLVEGLGGKEKEFRDTLEAVLKARKMPKAQVNTGYVNMWWRRDSLYVDITSGLDGTITTTVHLQEYGTSLFIGRAAESEHQSNYYKRMASSALLETVDRCIRETILHFTGEAAIQTLTDRQGRV